MGDALARQISNQKMVHVAGLTTMRSQGEGVQSSHSTEGIQGTNIGIEIKEVVTEEGGLRSGSGGWGTCRAGSPDPCSPEEPVSSDRNAQTRVWTRRPRSRIHSRGTGNERGPDG